MLNFVSDANHLTRRTNNTYVFLKSEAMYANTYR